MSRIGAVALILVAAAPAARGDGPELVVRDAYLMGTRVHLAAYAPTRPTGLATLESALHVLEDSERELSTWRTDSKLSALNRHPVGAAWPASARLCRLFSDLVDWHTVTGGAFDPAIGSLLAAWDVHGEGAIPDPEHLARARAAAGLPLFSLDRQGCTLTRRGLVTIDAGAFGKGEALDRVETALGAGPWLVDLGGQVSVGGPAASGRGWDVAVAHPLHRLRPYLHVRLTMGSLSTSAGSERDVAVGRTRVGHILDPRTGQPAEFNGSVSVWHRRALAADVLSTALYVMGPEHGFQWAQARGLAAAYLIVEDGAVRTLATDAFRALIAPE